MLIALADSVGMLCVTGVTTPITPNGGEFLDAKSVASAGGQRAQIFHAGDQFQDLQLFDLVIQPADFGFLQFHRPPLAGVLLGDGFDQLDDSIAVFHRKLDQLFLGFFRGGDGIVNRVEHAKRSTGSPRHRCGLDRPRIAQPTHHFADNILDQCRVHGLFA